ncbi:hypothetical protein Efla_006134 [Eimeria flavescens]
MCTLKPTTSLPFDSIKSYSRTNFYDDPLRRHRVSSPSEEKHPGALEYTEGHLETRRNLLSVKWLVAGYVIGLLLLLLSCHPTFSGRGVGGLLRRRLAEGGGGSDAGEAGPPSPDLMELCSDLGLWSPAYFPAGGQRASPLLVESFFESFSDQQTATVSARSRVEPLLADSTSTLGLRTKRAAPLDIHEDEEQTGSSLKEAKLERVAPLAFQASSPSAATTSQRPPSPTGGSGAENSQVHSTAAQPVKDAVAAAGSSVSSAATPAAGSLPSSGEASSGGTDLHPFLRAPTLEPGVTVRPFRAAVLGEPELEHHHILTFLRFRKLLRKSSLNQEDADELVANAEHLANQARHNMTWSLWKMRPNRLAERFGRRFLAFHLLRLASTALGQHWEREPWWEKLASIVDTGIPKGMRDETIPASGQSSWAISKRLVAATEAYKKGTWPSNDEVLFLMRKLFCLPGAPGRFKDSVWSPWREDAEHPRREHHKARSALLRAGFTGETLVADPALASLLGVRSPASDGTHDDDEDTGLSSKEARRENISPLTSKFRSPSEATSPPSTLGVTGSEDSQVHSSPAEPAEDAASPLSSAATPASDSPPSSGEASNGETELHPFLRVPPLEPGVKARTFRALVLAEPELKHNHITTIRLLRGLLQKRSLSQEDADELVAQAEHLANYARHNMIWPLGTMRPNRLAERLGRRFLAFHLLRLASTAVGQHWEQQVWWKALAVVVNTRFVGNTSRKRLHPLARASWEVSRRLVVAIEAYKAGNWPSDKEVLALMRTLFLVPGAPGRFREAVWNPWREDAEHPG